MQTHYVCIAHQDHLDDGLVPVVLVVGVEPHVVSHDAQVRELLNHWKLLEVTVLFELLEMDICRVELVDILLLVFF